MPIVISPGPNTTSSPQTVPTVQVFDYEVDEQGNPMANERVIIQLQSNVGSVASPQVLVENLPIFATTDTNGFWSVTLIPNNLISPSNTVYSVQVRSRVYDMQLPNASGPFQASTQIVNAPVNLPAATVTVTQPVTFQGLATFQGGVTGVNDITAMHLAGAETVTGVKTFSANPVFNAASIPIADITPTPATDSLAAHLAGAESFTGVKTFTANPVFNSASIPIAAITPTPGTGKTLLQTFVGTATGGNTTFTDNAVHTTGYPANGGSFSAMKANSTIIFNIEGDFNPVVASDVVYLGLYIDGSLFQNVMIHTSNTGILGIMNTAVATNLASGAHTLDCRVQKNSGSGTCTALTSTSWGFTAMEWG